VNGGDLFRELVEHCDVTAASRGQAGEEFAAACRRVDQDPRERQRIVDIANLIDTEDAIYAQALSALGRGEQNTALPLLQQAAEAGLGEAAWLLAGRLEEQGQMQESLTWYRHAAVDGDLRAARRIRHPLDRRASIYRYLPARPVTGDAQRPVRLRARGLLGSGWMTGIVNPALAAVAVVAVVAIAAVVTTVFPQRGAWLREIPASGTSISTSPLAAEATARTQAITWILRQVSRTAVVSCDAQVCADLVRAGFPAADLLALGPASADPLGSVLVVATPAIRAQYGSRLASVYAPAVIASFGSGAAKVDIRLVYPGGADEYRAVQGNALRVRKTAAAMLLTNRHITVSATARTQLLGGDIDPRLLLLLATMAASHPVRIVDFGNQSPGGGPASLLRSMDLATVDTAAHLTRAAYLGWMQALINAQTPQQLPAWAQQVTLRTGQAVLRIGYLAPSPLS
jgi:hypothetical protein